MIRRTSCLVLLGVLVLALAAPGLTGTAPRALGQGLTWTGSTDNTWDFNPGTTNWYVTGSPGVSSSYSDSLAITFDDTGANTNPILISGLVQPLSVTFNSTINPYAYSFTGGTIGGSASVTLNGSGSVVFNNVNSYTGGTYIEGPALLQLGPGGSLGTGALTVNAGTVDLGGNSQAVTNFNGVAGTITSSVAAAVTLTVSPTRPAPSAARCKMVPAPLRW